MRRLPSYPLALAAVVALGCAEATAPPPDADASSQRVLTSGEVVGSASVNDAHAWLGIPYARPPTGELRWRAPQPPEPWTGRREVLAPGDICVQLANELDAPDASPGTAVGSEDCLYLNVHAPRFDPGEVPHADARLPVMVWIHGGGQTIGSGGFYDGGSLASSHDVVVVTVNYRLGPFGWFRHRALRVGTPSEAERSGNFGTLDLIAALQWVRENASAFGGDPGNVTIFGESAGGTNVMTMLLSPRARGLFHRAILQSPGIGTTTPAFAENLGDAEVPGHARSSGEVLLAVLQADGKLVSREAARDTLRDWEDVAVADYLRSIEPAVLMGTYFDDPDEAGLGMLDMPTVFRDGTVIPRPEPREQFASGDYNRVPVIFGTNRDENKLFLGGDPELVWWILGVYPYVLDQARYDKVASYMSRAWKANAVDELAPVLQGVQGDSVFAYRFDWDEEPSMMGADLSKLIGAAHLLEVPFVFRQWNLGPRTSMLFDDASAPGRAELSGAMMSYWAEFAYTGAPGRGREGSLPRWTAWDDSRPDAPKFAVLDTSAGGGIRMSSETESVAALAVELSTDGGFETAAERCGMWDDMTRGWSVTAAAPGALLDCASTPNVASRE
jgi:para-nitrobenzyl esterase